MAISRFAEIDVGTYTDGHIVNQMPGNVGKLVFYNVSGYTIIVKWANKEKYILAGTIDVINVCEPAQRLDWERSLVLSNASQWPANTVLINGYTKDESLPYATYPVTIPFSMNVGNNVPISGSTTGIVNDGNAANTQFIEATPSDQVSSSVLLRNDASGFLKVLSANVLRFVLSVIRGDAISTKAQVQLGDSGDPSIMVVYGQIGTGSTFQTGQFTMSAPADTGNAQVFQRVATATGNADLLMLRRSGVGTANDLTFGIDTNGRLYIWDNTASAYALINASGTSNASGGFIQTIRTAGGGTPGRNEWRGTTDPASNASEGDTWIVG